MKMARRSLKAHTSAEDWLFGQQAAGDIREEPVLEGVQAVKAKIELELNLYSNLHATVSLAEGPLSWWRQHAPRALVFWRRTCDYQKKAVRRREASCRAHIRTR